jgi:hypothetical protein
MTCWSQSPNRFRGVGDCRARGEAGRLPTTAHRWPQHYGLSGVHRCCTGVEWSSARPARRHCPIPVRPRNAGCDNGPLMVGACAGAESGAGLRRDLRYVRQAQADAYTAARDWSTSGHDRGLARSLRSGFLEAAAGDLRAGANGNVDPGIRVPSLPGYIAAPVLLGRELRCWDRPSVGDEQ